MATNTLVINLNGAEPQLLRQWADDGKLPTLKRLFDQWFHCAIDIADAFGDSSFWTSVANGSSLGRHGRYFRRVFNPADYSIVDIDPDSFVKEHPFWYYCSRAGCRVGAIDFPGASLRHGLNGMQIVDWMSHDREGAPRSWPASFIDTISEKYGHNPVGDSSESYGRDDQDQQAFHEALLSGIDQKTSAYHSLLTENDWDLFCLTYAEPHDVGHQSWHWHDSMHPNHSADAMQQFGDPVLKIYQAIDRSLGKLLQSDLAKNVFLIAGLGMTRQTNCNLAMPQLLAQRAGLSLNEFEISQQLDSLPYFDIPNNMNAAAVRINLVDRERSGVVAEEDYQSTVDGLAEDLLQLVDADTGECVVDSVQKVHSVYTGKHAHILPDLMVIWKHTISPQAIKFANNPAVSLEDKVVLKIQARQGDHSNRAMFAANLHYVEKTIVPEAIAPTICRSLGVNLPIMDAAALVRKT